MSLSIFGSVYTPFWNEIVIIHRSHLVIDLANICTKILCWILFCTSSSHKHDLEKGKSDLTVIWLSCCFKVSEWISMAFLWNSEFSKVTVNEIKWSNRYCQTLLLSWVPCIIDVWKYEVGPMLSWFRNLKPFINNNPYQY